MRQSLTKAELVNDIAEETALSIKDTEKALKSIMENIEATLVADRKVQLIGFGSFQVVLKSARKGSNPNTGESIDIPEKLS